MVAINFQQRFAGDVEAGVKTQTIRAWRRDKRLFKAGEALQLYTGMRTNQCRKLADGVCTKVFSVEIRQDGMTIVNELGVSADVASPLSLNLEAQADGFEHWEAMRDWFDRAHGLPFSGQLICWRKASEAAGKEAGK